MRGGVTYSECIMMGREDREIVADIIKDNIENVKKTNLPLL
jgi:hypothetical protein